MNEEFCVCLILFVNIVNIVNIGIRLKDARPPLLRRWGADTDIYLANCSWRPLYAQHCFELH